MNLRRHGESRRSRIRERFWGILEPEADDDLLREIALLAARENTPATVTTALSRLGESIVPAIVRLVPSAVWPSVLFLTGTEGDFSSIGDAAARWAMRAPAVPLAVAVSGSVWDEFLATGPDSHTKAIFREGEVLVPVVDPATVLRTLEEAGASQAAASAVALNGADAALLDAALCAASYRGPTNR